MELELRSRRVSAVRSPREEGIEEVTEFP